MENHLLRKYDVPGPRYTSYPTVPYWNLEPPSQNEWIGAVTSMCNNQENTNGISIYIHLPYCESLCTFCGCNKRITINHDVELPYIHALIKEWEMYKTILGAVPLIKEIHLGGGTPTFFRPKNLEKLIHGIVQNSAIPENFEFGFEAHPNNTTPEHLSTLFNLGFRRLSLGIQDFDPKVQNLINRVQSVEQVKKVTEEARRLGYTSINFDIIYGLPLQTEQSIRFTIDHVRSLRPDRIAFYSYAHVPWKRTGQRKFTEADLPIGVEKRNLYELGKTLLEESGYIEIGMDHFALPTDSLYRSFVNENLHRNFMGYTTCTSKLLIGLGASAISDAWSALIQNEKTIEDYLRRIADGQFPIFKGHVLTHEDLILRRHILRLICHFYTEWENETDQCEGLYEGISRMSEFLDDGLVEIMPYHCRVTQKGKAFIRNICMALDARLWRNQPLSQIFSTTA